MGAFAVAASTVFLLGGTHQATAVPEPPPVDAVELGTAADYSVLAATTVTNIGPSVLAQNLGVSPGGAATGFPPGVVLGETHLADAASLQAQADLTIAYLDAAGRTPFTNLPAELGDTVLIPGVYRLGAAQLTGQLTLDAQNNPDAVFIFQVDSSLTTAANSSVVFVDGDVACNVFWQVTSSATLGANTDFVGTIMALASVTVNTGATLEGRALARTGQVSLDTNVINEPVCAAAPPATTTTTTEAPVTTTTAVPETTVTTTPATTLPATTFPATTPPTPTPGLSRPDKTFRVRSLNLHDPGPMRSCGTAFPRCHERQGAVSVMSRIRSASAPSLRSTWVSTVAVFIAVIAAVGAMALLGVRHQRVEFSSTTAALQETTEAMVVLERATIDVFEPMFGYLYRYGGDEQLIDAAWERYAERNLAVEQGFDVTARAIGSGPGSAELEQAREHWSSIDTAVRSSHDDVTEAELIIMFETGAEDPFAATVWEPYDQVNRELAAVRQATVAGLGDRIDDAAQTGRLVGATVFWSLLVAIGLALVTAQRMSRRVLVPLAELGRAAGGLYDTDDAEVVEMPRAVAEVQALARTINDTSITMRRHHALLRTQARTDSITALPNRDGFTEALNSMLDSSDRKQVAILFIDLDDFKEVNDTLGHAAGDEVLRVVALRLSAATRGCEIAARLGGDEFAVALDVGVDPTAAIAVAERVRLTLTGPVDIDGHQAAVGCSIGIVVSEADATSADADELLGNADFAMYMAKSQGKNRYELYSPVMHTEALARMELGRDLTVALRREQFVLHYQPVLDLPSGELLGFEALIRWQHPTRGLIAPDDFIGLAEDSGAIVEIGAWVLDQACAALANQHAHDPQLTMGVNVSPRQLVVPGFVDGVVQTIERSGIAPPKLVIEITEETAMTNTRAGADAIAALRDHGVHIALDDFGTGYSSLRYLADLPVNVIKIDRSFVTSRDPHLTSTLESIVQLAQRLGMFVVAEGIEDADDLERLARFGHIGGQGYFFARPMPAAEALALVQRAEPRTVPASG